MKFAQVQPAVSHGDRFSANQDKPEFVIETLFELPQILQHLNWTLIEMRETDILIGQKVMALNAGFCNAEIGINHDGSVSQAETHRCGRESGADAVKFRAIGPVVDSFLERYSR
jgi:hypothetical protein